MFEVRDAVKAAFDKIDGITVVTSSWKTVRTQYSLPAIVVDLESVVPGTVMEDGEVVSRVHTIPCSLHVNLTKTSDDDAEADLEAQMDSIEQALQSAFGNNFIINDWYPHDVPWGAAEALCGAFSLQIEQ